MTVHFLDIYGGNSNIFYDQNDLWGNDPIWRAYFSNGLKPPTTYDFDEETDLWFDVGPFRHFDNVKYTPGSEYCNLNATQH